MANLGDITLVIPAYNRPAYLERQIDYWSRTDVHLCILDGSTKSAPQSLIERMGKNVHYQHLPIGFNERLVLACDLVQTKYVALLGDDELYSVQGLKDCIETLESDSRLIACVGRALFFYHRDDAIYGDQVYEQNATPDGVFDNDIVRLNESFQNGNPDKAPYLLYGIFRTPDWKRVVRVSYGRWYSSGYVYELAFQIFGTLLGPAVTVDSLVWLRSGENPAMSSAAVNRKIPMGEWGSDPQYLNELVDFVDRIVSEKIKDATSTRSELKEVVTQVVKEFTAYSLHKPKRLKAKWHQILYFLNSVTPKFIKKALKRNMTPTIGKLLDYRGRSMADALLLMEGRGIKFDSSEMKELEQFLRDFHRKLELN
jgi:glycosyltransferase domain-containing protein